jgi:hypothetical protein
MIITETSNFFYTVLATVFYIPMSIIPIIFFYWLINFIFFMKEADSNLTHKSHPFSLIVFYWLISNYRKNLKR